MISRRYSRVFCELRSQKTPRGILPSEYLSRIILFYFICPRLVNREYKKLTKPPISAILSLGADRCRCASWSSKPVWGANPVPDGFDSHMFPPNKNAKKHSQRSSVCRTTHFCYYNCAVFSQYKIKYIPN